VSDTLEVGASAGADAGDEVGNAVNSTAEQRNGTGPSGEDLLVREGDVAGDYLERLLDLLDYDGDIDLDVEASRAVVSIDGGEDLQKLVGEVSNLSPALLEKVRAAYTTTKTN